MPEWNEPCEAPEPSRRCLGRPSSWSLVGCQSMGCMRSSKCDEGRSFHLRKSVQLTATRPTVEAMTTIMIRVLRVILDALAAWTAFAAADEVGVADVKTVWVEPPTGVLEVAPWVSVGVSVACVLAALLSAEV